MLPAAPHVDQRAADFFGRNFSGRSCDYGCRFALGGFKQLAVANDVGDAEARHPRLSRAEELAGAAKFEIEFGNLKAVVGAHHGLETPLTFFRNFASRHEDAVRLCGSAADSPAQLVKLCQAKALGMLDYHDRSVGTVH